MENWKPRMNISDVKPKEEIKDFRRRKDSFTDLRTRDFIPKISAVQSDEQSITQSIVKHLDRANGIRRKTT